MSRALKDVPMQLPTMPDGLVAYGEGRDRNYVYTENMGKIPAPVETPELPPQLEPNQPPTF